MSLAGRGKVWWCNGDGCGAGVPDGLAATAASIVPGDLGVFIKAARRALT